MYYLNFYDNLKNIFITDFGLLETPASNISESSALSSEISFQGGHPTPNIVKTDKKQNNQESTMTATR